MFLADKRKVLITTAHALIPLHLNSKKSSQSYFLTSHVTLPWWAGFDTRQYRIQETRIRREKLAYPAKQEEIQHRPFSEATQSGPGREKGPEWASSWPPLSLPFLPFNNILCLKNNLLQVEIPFSVSEHNGRLLHWGQYTKSISSA